jgi:hypothetical protein
MKKILTLGFALAIFTFAASAQLTTPAQKMHTRKALRGGQITTPERILLEKDAVRYHHLRHKALRDGRITPIERRRIKMAKRHERREFFRFRHNRFHRVH